MNEVAMKMLEDLLAVVNKQQEQLAELTAKVDALEQKFRTVK